jgi:uncharacterized protein
MLEPSRFSEPAGMGLSHPLPRRRVALLLAGAAAAVVAAGARAQSRLLDAPRAAGTVGERYDGLAMVRGAAPPDVAALVARVNAERRTVYAERAQTDKVSLDAVSKIYAAEIMKSAPPKTWFLSESGQWTQK